VISVTGRVKQALQERFSDDCSIFRRAAGNVECFANTVGCALAVRHEPFTSGDQLMRLVSTIVLGLLLSTVGAAAQQSAGVDEATVIYFVRHAEVDPTQPAFPLNAAGRLKADAFARAVSEVRFTHIFSSHTTRARQMVEPVALSRNLPVQQLPRPGLELDSTVVSDRTSSRVAIAPLVEALRALPAGSRALVGVNSDNAYAIMHGLGVPVATPEQPCLSGRDCVPCLTNACASPRYDQLWLLIIRRDARRPILIELRYGETSTP